MNLVGEAQRLRLDVFAVEVSRTLAAADIPHALIKGPTTASWLYDPPRSYSDVDMLVPRSRVFDAAKALADAGAAHRSGGRLGEEAPHSLAMAGAGGLSLDLHVTLPSLIPDHRGDRLWSAVSRHLTTFALDVGEVPALDTAGRCLVLALHALSSATPGNQSMRDLELGLGAATEADWTLARSLAQAIGHLDEFEAGLGRARSEGHRPSSPLARLYGMHAPGAALGLARLTAAPRRHRPLMLWRELFPSRAFMRALAGKPDASVAVLAGAYVRRARRIARTLPAAIVAYRASR